MTKKKKTSKFRAKSKLEESRKFLLKVWEYHTSMSLRNLAIQLSIIILLILCFQTIHTLKQKDTGHQPTDAKSLTLKKANPEIDLRMVFQSPYNTINKNLKQPMLNGVRNMTYHGQFISKYSNRMVGLMTESEFVRHMPCEECGSSDGNSLYSDGHTYCFVCHNRTGDNDVIHNQE